MKKAIIIHGWDGNPENCWFPWLKSQLEKKGFEVFIPEMPETSKPEINKWIGKLGEVVKNSGGINKETYFIGHSIGCQAILRYPATLEDKNNKIKGIILVAPWLKLDEQTIKEEGEDVFEIAKPWIETPINLDKVRKKAGDFSILYSTSDPYVSSDDLVILQKKLKAREVNMGDMGHFDDEAGIKEIPQIIDIIDEIESRKEL
jgi:hypothetical protein